MLHAPTSNAKRAGGERSAAPGRRSETPALDLARNMTSSGQSSRRQGVRGTAGAPSAGNQARLRRMSTASPAMSPRSGTGAVLQRKCACGGNADGSGTCKECDESKGAFLQRRAANETEPTEVPPIVYDVLRSPGQPLDPDVRLKMEEGFGTDFGHVRVHTDERAAASARAVNALAYTVGRDVVFGTNQCAPETVIGQRLIAHELAHVVQQQRGGAGMPSPSRHSLLEQDADQAADKAIRGEQVTVHSASAIGVARDEMTTGGSFPDAECMKSIIKGCEQGCSKAISKSLCVPICVAVAAQDESISGGYCKRKPKRPCSCVCYKAGVGPNPIGQRDNAALCATSCTLLGYPGYKCGGDVTWNN